MIRKIDHHQKVSLLQIGKFITQKLSFGDWGGFGPPIPKISFHMGSKSEYAIALVSLLILTFFDLHYGKMPRLVLKYLLGKIRCLSV
jgi:hypothetical protein